MRINLQKPRILNFPVVIIYLYNLTLAAILTVTYLYFFCMENHHNPLILFFCKLSLYLITYYCSFTNHIFFFTSEGKNVNRTLSMYLRRTKTARYGILSHIVFSTQYNTITDTILHNYNLARHTLNKNATLLTFVDTFLDQHLSLRYFHTQQHTYTQHNHTCERYSIHNTKLSQLIKELQRKKITQVITFQESNRLDAPTSCHDRIKCKLIYTNMHRFSLHSCTLYLRDNITSLLTDGFMELQSINRINSRTFIIILLSFHG